MTNRPLISIITVCYNSEKTIRKTLESVLAQTYDNYEYWIIDGLSSDGTVAIIGEYTAYFGDKLHVISERDSGIYNAMNKGIAHAGGDIIGIINSDDYYSPDTLKHVSETWTREGGGVLIISGDMVRVDMEGNEVFHYHFTDEQLKNRAAFGHPSMFAGRAVYDLIGLYDESYRLAADGDWQYRAHETPAVRWVLCPEVFSYIREGGATDKPGYIGRWFKERTRMQKTHNRGSSLHIFISESKKAVRTLIKAMAPKKLRKKMYKRLYSKKYR